MSSLNIFEKSWFDMCEEEEEQSKILVPEEKNDGFVEVKKRKRKEKIEEKIEEHVEVLEKKIYICKSLRNGTPCTFGDKCNYSHSFKELEPQQCSFGEKCGRVKINNNIVKNVDPNNPCAYLHGSETIKNYLIRHNMNEQFQLIKFDKAVETNNEFANTRLCTSIIDNTTCSKGAKCTYAHNPEQLKINPCMYGVSCFHVSKIDGEYINNTKSDKTCIFLHPDERLYNYASRVFKKKNVSPASSGFVTPKAKKTKTDILPPAPKKERKILEDRQPNI
jgi:hypothetical protein